MFSAEYSTIVQVSDCV